MQAGFSTVQKHISSLSVATFVAGVSWDAMIVMTPIMSPVNGSLLSIAGNPGDNWGAAGVSVGSINFITIITAPTGTELGDFSAVRVAGGTISALPIAPITDDYRFIAGGFEVVNSSAPLYKSGSVTVGHYDCFKGHYHDTAQTAVWGADTPANYTMLAQFPPNVNFAMAHPTALTWEAKDGCYVPARFISDEMAIEPLKDHNRFMVNDKNGDHYFSDDFTTNRQCNYCKHMEASFAYFTGLDAASTLRLVKVAYLEVFPTWSGSTQSALLPTLSPSAPYDITALRLYGGVAPRLPAGVPRTMNPGGEYWKVILDGVDTFLDAVSPIASIADPLAFGIPGAATAGLKLASKVGRGVAQGITNAKQKNAAKQAAQKQKSPITPATNAAGIVNGKTKFPKQAPQRPRKR